MARDRDRERSEREERRSRAAQLMARAGVLEQEARECAEMLGKPMGVSGPDRAKYRADRDRLTGEAARLRRQAEQLRR